MNSIPGILPLCGGCSQKEKRNNLGKDEFYCRYARDVFQDGIVTSDIDATRCVSQGYYRKKSS